MTDEPKLINGRGPFAGPFSGPLGNWLAEDLQRLQADNQAQDYTFAGLGTPGGMPHEGDGHGLGIPTEPHEARRAPAAGPAPTPARRPGEPWALPKR